MVFRRRRIARKLSRPLRHAIQIIKSRHLIVLFPRQSACPRYHVTGMLQLTSVLLPYVQLAHLPKQASLMDTPEIAYQQRTLAAYRRILAAYLREYDAWGAPDVPPRIANDIANFRREIMHIKAFLRSQNLQVIDDPVDDGSADERAQEIAHQRNLLTIYRRRMAVLLTQRAQAHASTVPTNIESELADLRQHIKETNAILEQWGITDNTRSTYEIRESNP
jgi:hypothetical protein